MNQDYTEEKLVTLADLLQYSLFFSLMLLVYLGVELRSAEEAPAAPALARQPVSAIAAIGDHLPIQDVRRDPFGEIQISASAAAVYDVARGRFIFSKALDERVPLASVTKLMTALAATEIGTPDEIVSIPASAIATEGDSGMRVGEKWRLKDLIDYTLVVSSNDGAAALALAAGSKPIPAPGDGVASIPTDPERKFVGRMNALAARIGLSNTRFNNETGLDAAEAQGGSYGSARDVSMLMAYIMEHQPALLSATRKASASISSMDTVRTAINTNPEAETIPGMLGGKTGYTDLAGGNLVIAFDAAPNEPIIVVALGSTPEGRFEDVRALADAARGTLLLEGTR